jgi:lipoate-protein ligase A
MELRVIDAGLVSAAHSQSLWHGIASAMETGDVPTLSFCQPAAPYVCLGYHGRLDEIDLRACQALGLPILRRQIGGGPVYIDSDQLFFQITLPEGRAPASVARLYRELLAPAVVAFRRLGLDARLDGLNDIVVSDRKLSGTGAGRIGAAVTVVGNVIFRFPHERMARLLALPSDATRADYLRLVRRYVSSLEAEGRSGVDVELVKERLRSAYSAGLNLTLRCDRLTPAERAAIDGWELCFSDPDWLAGPALPPRRVRTVKVRDGVWMLILNSDGVSGTVCVVEGKIERARLEASWLPGRSRAMSRALTGVPATQPALQIKLHPFGEAGLRTFETLAPAVARLH